MRKYNVFANEILCYLTTEVKANSKREAIEKYLQMIDDGNVEVNKSEIVKTQADFIIQQTAINLAFEKPLREILVEYKDGDKEPLDGDEVDKLVEHLRNKLNLMEGNITEKEYEKLDYNL